MIVPKRDAGALAAGIVRLMDDPGERAGLAANARELAGDIEHVSDADRAGEDRRTRGDDGA